MKKSLLIRKSQVTIEFLSFFAIATIMIIIFMVIFSELYQNSLSQKKITIANDFGKSIQEEFIIAAQVKPGYKRQFFLPDNVDGFEYSILNENSILWLNFSDLRLSFNIPITYGQIKKGNNIIEKNEYICVNC